MGPDSSAPGVLTERRHLDTGRHTGRRPHGDGGRDRDRGDVPTSQGTPRTASNHLKTEEVWNRLSPDALEGTSPAGTLVSDSGPQR